MPEPNEESKSHDNQSKEQSKDSKSSGDDSKTFTQDQVNAILAENKRTLRETNKELEGKFSSLQEQYGGLVKMLGSAAEEAGMSFDPDKGFSDKEDDDPGLGNIPSSLDEYIEALTPPKGVNPKLWKDFQSNRFQTIQNMRTLVETNKTTSEQLTSLQKSLEEERKIRLQAEDRARTQERDRLILESLGADCVDPTAGLRYFSPQLKYVDGKGWKFVPRAGAESEADYLPVPEGITKEYPPFLKRSLVAKGGSGSTGNTGGDTNQASQLQDLKNQTMKAAEIAQKTGRADAIANFQRLKREYDTLEKQAKQANV